MQRFIVVSCIVVFIIGLFPIWATHAAAMRRPCPEGYIELNTFIPFVGQCIKKTADPDPSEATAGNSFGLLLGGLTRIAMTVVLIVGFFAVLVGGVMIAAWGVKSERLAGGKKLIVKVILWILLLGASGIILNLINPNFFRTAPGLIIYIDNLF